MNKVIAFLNNRYLIAIIVGLFLLGILRQVKNRAA